MSRDQTTVLGFCVSAWAAWSLESGDLHLGGSAVAPGAVPVALRRRVSEVGRKMLEAAWAVLPRTGEPPTLRMILSSRHGEYARTFSLLTEEAETGTVSPADFSLSVHHALVGLLSIVTGNRVGHSAIAAGRESFASALLEAAACLAEGERDVLVLHFDSSLPDAYAEPKEEPVALALLLRPRNSRTGMPLRMERTPEPSSSCAMEATSLAARFVRLLSGEERDLSAAGARAIWRWHRDG